jgi:predicted DNA-binding transcriptional regulator AlpA
MANPKTYHIDKRAGAVAAATTGSGDELLTTPQAAVWLGVSTQWLEIARHRGSGGPPFERLSSRMIRYRRSKVLAWLDERSHSATSEYAPKKKSVRS